MKEVADKKHCQGDLIDYEKAWHYVDDDRHGFERVPEENNVVAWRSI